MKSPFKAGYKTPFQTLFSDKPSYFASYLWINIARLILDFPVFKENKEIKAGKAANFLHLSLTHPNEK